MKITGGYAIALLVLTTAVHATEFTFDTPSDDRWHYPFNFTPGFRATASCFGAVGSPGFNDRDAYVVVAWDTSALIPPGLGPDVYDIQSVTVTLTNQANVNVNPEWPIDLTADEWFTFDLNGDGVINADGIPRGQPGDTDGESDDEDQGRPLELFGVGFGPTHAEDTWAESSGYIGGTGEVDIARDPFPFVYQGTTFDLLHVEDNVAGLYNEALGVFAFTPAPWSLGVPIDYTPGAQSVPFDVHFELDLNLSDGRVRRYFQEQLNVGRVIVAVTSLSEVVIMGPQAAIPSFYMKEGVLLDVGAKPGSLSITLVHTAVPAVSEWGLIVMALLMLTVGSIVIRKHSGKEMIGAN